MAWLPPFHMPPYAGAGVPRIIGIEAPGFVAMVKMKGIIMKNEEGLTVASSKLSGGSLVTSVGGRQRRRKVQA